MMDLRIPRTVPQIPQRRAARFAPMERPRPAPTAVAGLFPIARQLIEAATHRERAGILLRLPDEIVLAKGQALKDACAACSFSLGAAFLDIRTAPLTAVRDREGNLPEHHLRTLEIWRRGFVALANGVKA